MEDSNWTNFADDFLTETSYQPPLMDLERFWALVEAIGWPSAGADAAQARLLDELTIAEAITAERRLEALTTVLIDAFRTAHERGDLPLSVDLDEDQLWEAAHHIVGLGREVFERESTELPLLAARLEAGELEPGFGELFFFWKWVPDATADELEAALRKGAVVRSMDDPVGLGSGDLVEHPEQGLGFVLFDLNTTWVWLVFRQAELSFRRHERPQQAVTLYREGDHGLEYWYGSFGPAASPNSDLFESSGPLGSPRSRRFHPPRGLHQAAALFDDLVRQRREQEGYAEVELPKRPLVVTLSRSGLVESPELRLQAIDVLTRALGESGNGHLSHLRVTGHQSRLFFEVADAEQAEREVRLRLTQLGGLDGHFAIDATDDAEGLPPLEVAPCEVREELPYFSKLAITADPGTDAWAEREAAEAPAALPGGAELDGTLASLAKLDPIIDRLRSGPATAEELIRASRRLGAYAGEVLRSAVGGSWGVGTLFGERIWYGLLLGPGAIKWWPVTEARRHLEGQLTESWGERCRRLVERAASQAPEAIESTDRLYPFAANVGYFDAGVTADGRQALMAAFFTDTFGLFFDDDGFLLEYATVAEVAMPPEAESPAEPSRAALEAWQRELGFEPRTIEVRAFSCADQGVGIEALPSHLQEFLDDPEVVRDPDERPRWVEDVQRWIEEGQFVLYWGNDLWLDADGRVTST